jgi:glycosyltransferase involved in cell wall biosynthesis
MPFFSVIIPLYNKEKFIEDTMKSILGQTFGDFEILIVNDGSTDNSGEKIQQFTDERIRYFKKENEGASTARNYGIEKATGTYIAFIDADDYWYPDFLQQVFENIGKFPGEKVFSAAIEIEMPGKCIPAEYSIVKTDESQVVDYFEASSKMSVIWTSGAAFHKSVFEKAGNFDTTIRSGQDTDLWIRIGMMYKVVFCPKILARYTHDSESLSKKKQYITKKLNFSKFAEAEKINPKLRKYLDLNRFSFAIKCKMAGDLANFEAFRNAIDQRNLTNKKRILLQLPGFVLRSLLFVNLFLAKIGFSKSVFR